MGVICDTQPIRTNNYIILSPIVTFQINDTQHTRNKDIVMNGTIAEWHYDKCVMSVMSLFSLVDKMSTGEMSFDKMSRCQLILVSKKFLLKSRFYLLKLFQLNDSLLS